MEIGLVLSVIQALIAVIKSEELKDICCLFGYESQLEELQRTVNTVKAVLLDAETKELNHEAQLYIEELKDAVYDADDLFDKFITLAKQKQLIKGGKATKKVRRFFSHYNPLGVAYNMSQGVKKIQKKLTDIANNHTKFGFSIIPRPISMLRDETCSYIYENHIVGRVDDVNKIIDHMFNDSNVQHDVSFLSIVGIGGMGKTAVAQLVYNDARVTNVFSLKIWTCVSDHDQEQMDEVKILRKILSSITGMNHEGSAKEWLCNQVREQLTNNRYFLVLDDVWTESPNQWLKLVQMLLGSQKKSWIVVTTRSHETARIIGDGPKYELRGLSEEDSWCLFKKIAFGSEQSPLRDDLVNIGRNIVEGCVGVPLAIRVAAALLAGQDKNKWLSFQNFGLSNFKEGQKGVLNILKFSYHQLESPLKSCFVYCALFPKDYRIDKELLLSLWMAQGYVDPLYYGQTVEKAAEDYFSILLQRCFFQEVELDWYDNIITCKMHDLMHDLAQKVAGNEICITDFATIENVANNVRHLAYTSSPTTLTQTSFTKTNIRSYHKIGVKFDYIDSSALEALVRNWTCLRVLDLRNRYIINLPKSISKLLHLRYLDISKNDSLQVLPKSIVELYNLETLKIGGSARGCQSLKQLPENFVKLLNLRTLEISNCRIVSLAGLETLPYLKTLILVTLSELEYIICSTEDKMVSAEGLFSYMSLEKLMLCDLSNFKGWRKSRVEEGDVSRSNTTPLLLPQLKLLRIQFCYMIETTLLCPKLETLSFLSFTENLQVCNNVRSSTLLSSSYASYGVATLRYISVDKLRWLKRMPLDSFQCLEKLRIINDNGLESLREVEEMFHSCSSHLSVLKIECCNNLAIEMSGVLEHLTSLQTLVIECCFSLGEEENERKDEIRMILPSLRHLRLFRIYKLENLPNWMQFLANLETLEIEGDKLKAMPEWMAKLTSLRKLQISSCSERLKKRCQNSNGEDWPFIQHIPSIYVSSAEDPESDG